MAASPTIAGNSAMSGIFVPALYVLSGACGYAALHHWLIASRRPIGRTHLLFAMLCVVVLLYLLAKTGGYRADSAQALVAMRRWDISFSMVFFGIFPWFVGEYTAVRPRGLLAGLSGFMFLILAVNVVLPHGVTYVELPQFRLFTLPWGEKIADLRVRQSTAWFRAGWIGIYLAFAYSGCACVQQYRTGASRSSSGCRRNGQTPSSRTQPLRARTGIDRDRERHHGVRGR
jgi:hypothetical protein